jgi:hypothetical protein
MNKRNKERLHLGVQKEMDRKEEIFDNIARMLVLAGLSLFGKVNRVTHLKAPRHPFEGSPSSKKAHP